MRLGKSCLNELQKSNSYLRPSYFFLSVMIYQDYLLAFLSVRQLQVQLAYEYLTGKDLVRAFMLAYKLELGCLKMPQRRRKGRSLFSETRKSAKESKSHCNYFFKISTCGFNIFQQSGEKNNTSEVTIHSNILYFIIQRNKTNTNELYQVNEFIKLN